MYTYVRTHTHIVLGQSGGPLPINVSIEGCGEPPCDVIKNETAIMRIHFVGSKCVCNNTSSSHIHI